MFWTNIGGDTASYVSIALAEQTKPVLKVSQFIKPFEPLAQFVWQWAELLSVSVRLTRFECGGTREKTRKNSSRGLRVHGDWTHFTSK